MSVFTESVVEEAALDWFRELGYTVVAGPDMAPETGSEARASYGEVIFSRLTTCGTETVESRVAR